MNMKPKAAFYWCASCGGCEETVVDLEEKILDVVAAVDIVFWPCAMDFKYSDIEKMPDNSISVTFINGAVRSSEQKHAALLLRKKSAIVIAFGSCAVMGGIPALANLTSRKDIFKRSYLESPTVENNDNIIPEEKSELGAYTLTLPACYKTVQNLAEIIDVDYYLPGCPPTAKMLTVLLDAILKGNLPPKGSTLLSEKTLCTSCERNKTKPENITISNFKRIHEVNSDPAQCFLAQGVICMGPATRDGCEYPCIRGNMPCTGCTGPVSEADQGARLVSALGGIISADSDHEVNQAFNGIPDPAGTFYRYSLSSSLLGSKRREK